MVRSGWALAYEIYSGGGPSTYIYCVVCYCVIVAPYVRSVGHVFAHLYTLDDDLERPMDYESSLLPKGFPWVRHNHYRDVKSGWVFPE